MTNRSRLIILLLAIIGLGVAGESTWVHHKLLTDASYTPPCDVNASFNCSQVYMSRYGSLWGVPVALGGVVWFGLVGLVAGFAKPAKDPDPSNAAGAYLFLVGVIGLASILSLAYASFFVLKTYCLLCLATYACVIGIFVTAGMTPSVPLSSLPGRVMRDVTGIFSRPMQATASLVYVVVMALLIAFFPSESSATMTSTAAPPALDAPATPASSAPSAQGDPKTQFEAWWNAQPRIETGEGLQGAKVVVVKFSDFQCPGCKQTWLMYKPVLDKYTKDQVRYVMKDFPLQPQCNVAVQQQVHASACDAAVAFRAAEERGKGPEMENWIFTNQTLLTAASIREAARTIAGITDFDREYGLKLARIKKDTADGGALQISSTPTFFINGVKLPTGQWLNPEYFDYAIQLEIKKAGGTAAQPAGGSK